MCFLITFWSYVHFLLKFDNIVFFGESFIEIFCEGRLYFESAIESFFFFKVSKLRKVPLKLVSLFVIPKFILFSV